MTGSQAESLIALNKYGSHGSIVKWYNECMTRTYLGFDSLWNHARRSRLTDMAPAYEAVIMWVRIPPVVLLLTKGSLC